MRDARGVPDDILGVSRSLIDDAWTWPVHGLRHPPERGTSGWYVWTGDFSETPDFFAPWHTSHLVTACPEVAHLLALPPGSRFLIAPGHEDVWEDPSLLDTNS
jgi:hypothetical protein